jgi:sugar phosphate isomerase/epimerase
MNTKPVPDPRSAPGLERLALNTATTKRWTLAQAADGCVRAGIPGIGLWRDRVQEAGPDKAATILRDRGLTVTSLCRGGFFTASDPDARRTAQEDNRKAVDEAATVTTDVLVLVCGGLPNASRDLPAAREMVTEAIAELAPYAHDHGIKLAIEPLHPMFCADRAVVSTLGQALDIADQIGAANVGVVVDTYHVWWDPQLYAQIERAGATARLFAFQVCDWVLPLPEDVLLGRGHVGDGHIDIPAITAAVLEAGYQGLVEVEIFNERVWATPGDQTLDLMAARHRQYLSPLL